MTFALHGSTYVQQPAARFPTEGLALTIWEGSLEGTHDLWLRWTNLDGRLLPSAEESEARAERFAERLRAAGIDPDAP